MTPAQYKTERTKRGSQRQVAALLGVHPNTVARRERGELPVTQEAILALTSLPIPRKRNKANVESSHE